VAVCTSMGERLVLCCAGTRDDRSVACMSWQYNGVSVWQYNGVNMWSLTRILICANRRPGPPPSRAARLSREGSGCLGRFGLSRAVSSYLEPPGYLERVQVVSSISGPCSPCEPSLHALLHFSRCRDLFKACVAHNNNNNTTTHPRGVSR